MNNVPTYRVLRDGEGWVVEREGAPDVRRFPTRQGALLHALQLAEKTMPVKVFVHSSVGSIERLYERSRASPPTVTLFD